MDSLTTITKLASNFRSLREERDVLRAELTKISSCIDAVRSLVKLGHIDDAEDVFNRLDCLREMDEKEIEITKRAAELNAPSQLLFGEVDNSIDIPSIASDEEYDPVTAHLLKQL